MLVANDITIDTRVRKTASSLARVGFSVIALGIDVSGEGVGNENLDGAVLTRVSPTSDPRVSPRVLRLSRPEIADRVRYRNEIRRRRLQSLRRTLSADVARVVANPPRWPHLVGELGASASGLFGLSEQTRTKVGRRLASQLRRVDRAIRFTPRKAATVLTQAFHQASRLAHRFWARPSNPIFGHGSWRRDLPELHRYEAAIGPMVDSLEADLVHVHDIFLLGVAARAKARAHGAGRSLRLLYDAHEYVMGLPIDPRRRAALSDLESEYFHSADAAVTVSEGLAELLETRFGRRPAVVMNAPDADVAQAAMSVRSVAGVRDDSMLIVYVGGIAPHRGAETLIEAMHHLPADAHLAFVSNSVTGYVAGLMDISRERGLAERVHVVPYVPSDAVVDYIRSADVSAIPLSRDIMNYEVALPNKLFQSIHAGVPVAVSDNPEMERFVTKHGVGEVFRSGDPVDLARALTAILESPEHYTSALNDPELLTLISWSTQVETLIDVYESLGVIRP